MEDTKQQPQQQQLHTFAFPHSHHVLSAAAHTHTHTAVRFFSRVDIAGTQPLYKRESTALARYGVKCTMRRMVRGARHTRDCVTFSAATCFPSRIRFPRDCLGEINSRNKGVARRHKWKRTLYIVCSRARTSYNGAETGEHAEWLNYLGLTGCARGFLDPFIPG